MTTPNVQVRRATVEDVKKLVPLWQVENLPCQELEKRFREFQVVEGPGGEVLGALGLQIVGQQAYLHSEVFAHFEQADMLREKLWERAEVLAHNHGLVRVWTQSDAPFWHHNGFQVASQEILAKLPDTFGKNPRPWLYLQLKEETAAPAVSLDKEFALFQEAERERTQQIYRQARVMKLIATIVAIVVFVLIVIWAISFFKIQKRLPGR
jgi:N-acetylglutamate synthase-like GNAT family acetyltransferase